MGPAACGELSILVVDNSSNMQSIVAGMLRSIVRQGRKLFREVRKSTSLPSSLQILRKDGADFILCDVHPCDHYAGIELLKSCYNDRKLKHLPFIMMTGTANSEILPALAAGIKEWGAYCLLIKPFSQVVLEEKIDWMLTKLNSSETLIYRRLDDSPPREALSAIDQLEEKGFRAPKLHNIAGEKHLELGEDEKAAERFEKAVEESEATFLVALRNHAQVQEKLGNLEEAASTLEKLDMLSPFDVDRKLKLGSLFLQTGNQEKGLKVLDQASAVARKLGKEAEVKEKIKEVVKASKYEDNDIKTIRENLSDLKACNEIALRLRKEGKFERAEACYDFILEHHPNHPVVLYNKAALYMVQERYREAAAILSGIVAERPFPKAEEALKTVREHLLNKGRK